MPPVDSIDNTVYSANRLGDNGINGEGILGINHLLARLHESACNDFQYIVGTVTQGDLIGIHPQFFTQRRLEYKTVSVRIACQFVIQLMQRLKRQGTGSQGIFIRREFHNPA